MKRIAMALLAAIAGTATAQNSQSRQVASGAASATVTVNPRGNGFAVVVDAWGPGRCSFSSTLIVVGNTSQPINQNCNAGGVLGDVRIGGSIQVTNFRREGGQAAMSVTVSGTVVDRITNPNFFAGGDVDGATLGSANERFDLVVEDPVERARLAERAEAERRERLVVEQTEAARRARVAAEEAEVQRRAEAQRQAEAQRLAQIAAEQAEAERQAEARRQARIAADLAEAQRLERLAAEQRAVTSGTRASRQRLQGFGTDGRRVRQVTFTIGSGEGFLHLDGSTWNVLDGTGRVLFRFREASRDDWSVYLWDDSRNVGLQADLHTRRVNYMSAPGAAYTFLYTMVDAR